MLCCPQNQRLPVPPSTWVTIADIHGSGVVTKFFFAIDANGGVGNARAAKLRITANGAPIPQIGGVGGMPVEGLFGAGHSINNTFRSDVVGLTKNQIGSFSGYWRLPIPFGDGLKIEVFAPNSTDSFVWSMVEYGGLDVDSVATDCDWVLNGSIVSSSPVSLSEVVVLKTEVPTHLLGFWHFFSPQLGGSNFYYLEGDYRFYSGSTLTPFYRSSGTEDFYGSSYYFSEGLYASSDCGLTVKDNANGKLGAYRWFDRSSMPFAQNGIRVTWQNGDPDYAQCLPNYTTPNDCCAYYYTKK